VNRYNRILKKIAIDLAERKFISISHATLRNMINQPLELLEQDVQIFIDKAKPEPADFHKDLV